MQLCGLTSAGPDKFDAKSLCAIIGGRRPGWSRGAFLANADPMPPNDPSACALFGRRSSLVLNGHRTGISIAISARLRPRPHHAVASRRGFVDERPSCYRCRYPGCAVWGLAEQAPLGLASRRVKSGKSRLEGMSMMRTRPPLLLGIVLAPSIANATITSIRTLHFTSASR